MQKIFGGVLLMLVFFSLTGCVFAVDSTGSADLISKDSEKEIKVEQCLIIEEKITDYTASLNKNREKHLKNYQEIAKKLNGLVAFLEDNNLDVADLKNNVVVFEKQIADWDSVYADYIAAVSDLDCNSQVSFVMGLKKAEDKLKDVSNKALEIKMTYENDIKGKVESLLMSK